MHIPHLQPEKQSYETQDLFFGLNHNLRLRPGEFYDMENLTSDRFPVLSPRPPRGLIRENTGICAMTSRDGLVWVEGGSLYLNGQALDLRLREGEKKQLVNMGAYLIILPDKVYVNTADPADHGPIEAEVTTAGPVTLCQCNLEGQEIRPSYVGGSMPPSPLDGEYWLDLQEKKLRQYAAATGIWVVLEAPLVKLSCPGIGGPFRRYDGVEVSGLPDQALSPLNGSAILYGREPDRVIFPGLLEKPLTVETPVTLCRKMPKMDFVVESGNRLWGCRYGPDDRGQVVNELYCSKLGDFRNWSCYLGISTDSYRVSLGSDGPFTGAAVLGGHPLFFKEKCLHKVFGQFPANFQVQTSACRGVERGSAESLAIVSEVLYYKSTDGICAYDGSMPREISGNLGPGTWRNGVAAALKNKYYVSMETPEGSPSLLVYDTERGLWHREDQLRARLLCSCREDLFCVDDRGNLLALLGTAGTPEKELPWMAETGIIGVARPGNRYLKKLHLRLQLEPGSMVTALVQYDSTGLWETLGTVEGMNLRSFVLPVLPRRCDHFRLRLRGTGMARLFSVTQVLSPGGESTW